MTDDFNIKNQTNKASRLLIISIISTYFSGILTAWMVFNTTNPERTLTETVFIGTVLISFMLLSLYSLQSFDKTVNRTKD